MVPFIMNQVAYVNIIIIIVLKKRFPGEYISFYELVCFSEEQKHVCHIANNSCYYKAINMKAKFQSNKKSRSRGEEGT